MDIRIQLKIIIIGLILTSCNTAETKSTNPNLTVDGLKNAKIENLKKTMSEINSIDNIDILVAGATKTGSAGDLTKLWKATLKLKQWHFITKYKADIQDSVPFIGVIDNQPWVFIFTDRQKAEQYCLNEKNDGFTDTKGTSFIISMDTEKAVDYILDLHSKGVYGMRINEGNGWFSPIADLTAIIEYVKKTSS